MGKVIPAPELAASLAALPHAPGVYELYDASGRLLYVGKAVDLYRRVRSYWQKRADDHRVRQVIGQVTEVRYTLTRSSAEALQLEAELIDRHKPPYNIRLRTGRSYSYIKVTLAEDYPRVVRTREIIDDGSRYFGPYLSGRAADELMELAHRLFMFRTCDLTIPADADVLSSPCLLYHIKRCQAPCLGNVAVARYRESIELVMNFLSGRRNDIRVRLQKDMDEASERLDFEQAARLRDRLSALKALNPGQRLINNDIEQDGLSIVRSDSLTLVAQLIVREGRLSGHENHELEVPSGADEASALSAFIGQFYSRAPVIPSRILIDRPLTDQNELAVMLSERAGRRIIISRPTRGPARQLVELAGRNAKARIDELSRHRGLKEERARAGLTELAEMLGLPSQPARIEGYDVSHLGGQDTTGSMVVIEDGLPAKSEYRRFRLAAGGDDLAAMTEMLSRRFRRPGSGLEGEAEANAWRRPELIMLDGGPTQIAAGAAVLSELGLDIPLISLAKEHEEIWLPDEPAPLRLSERSPARQLLQRLRDEAHRFALTHQRKVRARRATGSVLDTLPGIGQARRRALLRHFGSLTSLRTASVEEIAAVPGFGPDSASRLRLALDKLSALG